MNLSMKGISVKNNLGKHVFTLILISITTLVLAAEDFRYDIHVNTHTPYVKEPLLLTIDLNQTNHDVVLLFNFDLEKNEAYTFHRISMKEKESQYHDAKIKYTYLIYPLKSGDLTITFTLVKKVTTDAGVAFRLSGDRDNINKLVTTDIPITIPPLHLKVKPLPSNTDLVGDFTLEYKTKKDQAKAFEPIPFQVHIKGKGYPPILKTLLPLEGEYNRFSQKPIQKSTITQNDTVSEVIYPMALSHDKDFSLPPIILHAFNPKTEKAYTLQIPPQKFKITSVPTQELLDTIDYPKEATEDWSWLQNLLGYGVVFFSGFVSALLWKWGGKKKSIRTTALEEKIKASQTPKSLLQVLLASNRDELTPFIQALEESVYGNKPINFGTIKKTILTHIRTNLT